MTPTLTRAAFAAWLAQFPDENVIAVACDGTCCPIAKYCAAPDGLAIYDAFVDIGDLNYRLAWADDWHNTALPAWASAFVEMIDERIPETDSLLQVTAGTAREILVCIPDDEAQP